MKYTDDHGNVCVHLVERPDIISKFFQDSNIIDKDNQSRQFDLALEKTWLTQDPYFRLSSTLIGMIVVNTWKLADWHKILNPPNAREDTRITIQRFSGVLCYQFVTNTSAFVSFSLLQRKLLSEISLPAVSSTSTPDISSVTQDTLQQNKENVPVIVRTIKDNYGLLHHQVPYPVTVGKNGKRSTLIRECKLCKEKGLKKHLVGHYCLTCGEMFAYCCPSKYNTERDCFKDHVAAIKRTSG
jgi:hypothetical protein